MPWATRLWAFALAALLLTAAEVAGETPSKGRFLVAERRLTGSGFAESVVLLIRYDPDGAMGLVVNRTTPVRVSNILPGVEGLDERGDRTFLGGPVETNKIFLLVHSADSPADAEPVIPEVYFGNSIDLISAQAAKEDADFRVFAGYSGWAPGQLDGEMEEGAWRVLPADAATVFDPNPEGLWDRLIGQTDVRIATAPRTSAD